MDRLYERGLISDPKSKAKSVVLTEPGRRAADLDLSHRERGFEGEHPRFPGGGSPAIHHDLEGHAIYCLQRCGHRYRDRRPGQARG